MTLGEIDCVTLVVTPKVEVLTILEGMVLYGELMFFNMLSWISLKYYITTVEVPKLSKFRTSEVYE